MNKATSWYKYRRSTRIRGSYRTPTCFQAQIAIFNYSFCNKRYTMHPLNLWPSLCQIVFTSAFCIKNSWEFQDVSTEFKGVLLKFSFQGGNLIFWIKKFKDTARHLGFFQSCANPGLYCLYSTAACLDREAK